MRAFQAIFGIFALVALVAFGTYDFGQYRQLIALRARLGERAALKRRVEKERLSLAAMEKKLAASKRPEAPSESPADEKKRLLAKWRGFRANDQVLGRYGALFQKLGLDAEQKSQLALLILRKRKIAMLANDSARTQGISDPTQWSAMMAGATASIDAQIQTVLGDSGAAQLREYEETMSSTNTINRLQQMLAASASPLTSDQAETLTRALAGAIPPEQEGMIRFSNSFGGNSNSTLSPEALAAIQPLLSPEQTLALQQLQAIQGRSKELIRLLNSQTDERP